MLGPGTAGIGFGRAEMDLNGPTVKHEHQNQARILTGPLTGSSKSILKF